MRTWGADSERSMYGRLREYRHGLAEQTDEKASRKSTSIPPKIGIVKRFVLHPAKYSIQC